MPTTRVMVKTSTIFVSTAKRTAVYKSLDEVPSELRRRLERSTTSDNSATILIADRRGRQELIKALRGEGALRSPQFFTEQRHARVPASLRRWLEILLPVAIGASLWAFIGINF